MGISGRVMMRKIKNYHTHTLFCGHGKGYPIDYVNIALENNFAVLGFSEHAPIDIPAFYFTIFGKENEYFNEVNSLKNKYSNLEILCGLEVDYFEDFHNYYDELLKKYDYISLSCHYTRYKTNNLDDHCSFHLRTIASVFEYKELLIAGMRSKYFSFVNHPDLFITYDIDGYDIVTKEIVDAAIECDLPLELNLNQIRVKPHLYQEGGLRYDFWKYVGTTNAKVIINFDAHLPEFLASNLYAETINYANKLNLNLVDEIKKVKK